MFAVIYQKLVVILILFILGGHGVNLLKRGKSKQEVFEVAYYFHLFNFTWPSLETYQTAVSSRRYIPQNVGISAIKAYKDNIFLTLPRFSTGIPVTLATLPINSPQEDPLLHPYPNWEQNVGEDCSTLQNVQAVEVDTKGVLWVLDGNRFNNLTRCPPKIVLLDINRNGTVIQTYEVPNELSAHKGGWMNDLVIDESDGGYAYISEVGSPDPGIIVYSRKQNKGWKLRDRSMFQELDAANYIVHGVMISSLYSIDGIALAPVPKCETDDRLVYYTSLTGFSLYALSTRILKNESLSLEENWRGDVQYVGRRSGQTDGMMIDNEGNLYFGLLDKNTIAKWNIYKKPFDKYVENIYTNNKTVDWPDGFGFDSYGNLYVTSDQTERTLNSTAKVPPPKDGIKTRILRLHTGTQSYLYS